MFALVVRTLETKQFCQTCAVGVVFNHAKFDAKIDEENSVKSENVLSSQLASWSELKRANVDDKISNEEFRRRGLVDIAGKIREARLKWYGHVIRRDEKELVRDIMECRDQKIWGGRHCREGEESKVEMIWRSNKKRLGRAGQRYYGMKRSEDVGW